MGHSAIWHSHPRKIARDVRTCKRCLNNHGIIRKYDLMLCRRCFRECANQIGFFKLR